MGLEHVGSPQRTRAGDAPADHGGDPPSSRFPAAPRLRRTRPQDRSYGNKAAWGHAPARPFLLASCGRLPGLPTPKGYEVANNSYARGSRETLAHKALGIDLRDIAG